jgi:hypothetical protein
MEKGEGGGRRTLLKLLAAALALPLLRPFVPGRWVRAVRDLDLAEVRKPGRWAG